MLVLKVVAIIAHMVDIRATHSNAETDLSRLIDPEPAVTSRMKATGRVMKQKGEPSPYFSESLSRGLAVLRAFDRDAPRLRIGEVAERAGLNRAAARRYLLTLRDLGYVASEKDSFMLRPRVLDLGYSYFAAANIGTTIQPLLAELAERTQEAATFAVRDELQVLVVARAAKRLWDLSVGTGSRLPLLQTALGRALLADLPEQELNAILTALNVFRRDRPRLLRSVSQVRRQEYAFVQAEFAPKLAAIAVPIWDRDGRTLAAVNVTSYTSTRATLVDIALPALKETKAQIEAALRSSDTSTLINPRDSEF